MMNMTKAKGNCTTALPRGTTRFRAFVLGLLGVLLIQINAVSAQNYTPNVQGRLCPEGTNVTGQFSVTGNAETLAPNDMGMVAFKLFATENTLAEASDEGNRVAKVIKDDLLKLEFLNESDITTTAFLVQPNYEDNKNTAVSNYTYSQSMIVRSESDNISDVIDAVIGAGENNVEISQTQFYVSDERMRGLQNDLRKEAVSHATETAQVIASSVGATLGAVTYISDSFYAPYLPFAMAADDGFASAENTAVVSSGAQKIEGSISLTYELCA